MVVPLRTKMLKYSILEPHLSLLSHACVHAKSLQLCLTLCRPMDCSLQGSSVHGVLQARILEWVALPYSRDLPDPGSEPSYKIRDCILTKDVLLEFSRNTLAHYSSSSKILLTHLSNWFIHSLGGNCLITREIYIIGLRNKVATVLTFK